MMTNNPDDTDDDEHHQYNQGYELYKRGYGGGQGAAVEGKWKEGHVPDTSLVMQLVRLTLVRHWMHDV